MVYRTYFKLDWPVNDIDAAREYLTEDDMTKYLKADFKDLQDRIVQITWVLKEADCGFIELETTDEFTQQELSKISDWVKGQNSDGLGEGFEQQLFSRLWDEDEQDYDYDCVASFDWPVNDYIFELYNTEQKGH